MPVYCQSIHPKGKDAKVPHVPGAGVIFPEKPTVTIPVIKSDVWGFVMQSLKDDMGKKTEDDRATSWGEF
jgi:hypothetical protein